jgi:hypothetical protein
MSVIGIIDLKMSLGGRRGYWVRAQSLPAPLKLKFKVLLILEY